MESFFAIALWVMTIMSRVIHEATSTDFKWNKHLQDFEPIPVLRSRGVKNQQNTTLLSRQEEIHNFNGQPLRIFYFENPGFFEFYDNDTKATGICGDIWTVLSHFLNFTLVLKKFERNLTQLNHNSRGINKALTSIRNNKSDIVPKLVIRPHNLPVTFTPVLWSNRQRIFAPVYLTVNRDWMFHVFSVEVWALIITFTLTLGIASVVTQKMLFCNKVLKLRDRSYFAHVFYTFASICNQGSGSDNAKSGSRMLTFTLSIFSWLILAAYSSCLIHNMTQDVVETPYHNLVTLFKKTNLEILVLAGSVSHLTLFNSGQNTIARRIVTAKRASVELDIDILYRKVCEHPDKYVLWDEEDAVATRNITYCRLFPADKPRSRPMLISSGIRNTMKNKRSIDIGILKLQELGVIHKIINRYMPSEIEEPTMKQATLFIDMYRVSIIFAILAVGIFASIVICVIENIVCSLNLYKNSNRTYKCKRNVT